MCWPLAAPGLLPTVWKTQVRVTLGLGEMILMTCITSLLKQLLIAGAQYDLLGWAGAPALPPEPQGLMWKQRLLSEGDIQVILTKTGL